MVDIIIVMICFVLSAIIPQALYFILPLLFLYTLLLQESLSINRLTKITVSWPGWPALSKKVYVKMRDYFKG